MEDNAGAASSATTGEIGAVDGGAGNIKIKVTYGSNNFDVFTSPQSTFADLKQLIAKATGLDPKVQNVLFRGKENDDHESLHTVGVKDNAKVILIENSPAKEDDLETVEEVKENIEETSRTVEEVKENIEVISRGLEAVNLVREENNQFAEQVASLEAVVCSGTQVADKDFVFVTEMLMRQLLKLDGIDCEGEGRIQRKSEVRRVQGLVEKLDNLREKNSNPTSDVPETSDEPALSSSSKVTQDWETFE
ncbi:putative Ubiquitin-like domain, BAG domain, Ubiquitin-like domain superfamily [Helianthus annuus]|nr:putative Ubiquitin-like domain, BAG domain, Ubiquitin-like domain superfamily [Helianthus annuus]KAJ0842690.1 putative Ubiquitin-like domain, BAG domain, Ubiquitin-like domain superfamily [Helianthus annuus]